MDAPEYTIEYEDRENYLFAKVSGQYDSVQTKLDYFTDIAAECRARGLRKVLVLETIETNVSYAEVSGIAVKLAPIVKGLIVAFVDTQPDHHEVNRLGEAATVDRGAVGRLFRHLPEAERWISLVP